MAGIKDIAKKAGVSISTVSYALNNSPLVAEETRKRILKIADELDYVPNMAARTLKRQRTEIVGVYLADYGGSFFGELLEGIKQGLEAHNHEMIVCSGIKSHDFIPERMIDGAIILDWTFSDAEIIRLADQGHVMVVLDRELQHKNVKKIILNNRDGATLATEKIIEKNPKMVYLFSGPENGFDGTERLNASVKELERFNVEYQVIRGAFTEESGYLAAKELITYSPEYPLAIFSLNDEMAVGAYKYFEEQALEIGKDVHIIGFDNAELGAIIRPRLATISYSKHRWGMIAAEKIIRLINNEPTEDEYIHTTFVAGGSFNL